MKIKNSYTVAMPDYAICYLANGDSSGLSDNDKRIIDLWYDKEVRHNDCKPFDLVFDFGDLDTPFFTNSPEFGLPCTCYEVTINIFE